MAAPLTTTVRDDLRIGELSRRVGVPAVTLRAWERRYGLLEPRRTPSGYRLYGPADEQRIRKLIRLRDQGVATREAARLAREDPHLAVETGPDAAIYAASSQADARVAGRAASSEEGAGASAPAPLRAPVPNGDVEELAEALVGYHGQRVNELLGNALDEVGVGAFVEQLVLPALREVGERWERGDLIPAQEHFASSVIRGHLLTLARDWAAGSGPLALLACPPGERHDLGLIAFGLLLRERGWRVAFLGQDTPVVSLGAAAEELDPDAIVLAAVDSRRLRESAEEVAALAQNWRVFIGGDGASRRFAFRTGAQYLEGEASYGASVLDETVAAAAA